jgi:hypothetical protein
MAVGLEIPAAVLLVRRIMAARAQRRIPFSLSDIDSVGFLKEKKNTLWNWDLQPSLAT